MLKWTLRVGLVALLLVATTAGGVAEEKKGPATLADVFARHGSGMVEDGWAEALRDLHVVFGEEAAFQAHKKATQEAMEQFNKKAYYDAAISFGLLFRSILSNPTGNEADSVYAALIFRAREVSLSRAKDACTKEIPKRPMGPDEFDETFLTSVPPDASAADQFKRYCLLDIGFTYLAVSGDDFTELFPAQEQEERLARLLFAQAEALERAHGEAFRIVRHIEYALAKVGDVESPGDQATLKQGAKALVERFQERVEYALAGYTLKANVAWYAAQLAQQQSDTAAQSEGIGRAYESANMGAMAEETYVAVREAFGLTAGRSLDVHRLTATLAQLYMQQSLAQMHALGRQNPDAIVAAAAAQVSMERALKSLATLVQYDASDWTSRLSLAELLIMKEGTRGEGGVTVHGNAAATVKQLLTEALSIGTDLPDVQYRGGRLLLSARLPGAQAPLERFLQLAPGDPRADEVKTWLQGLRGQ